MVTVVMASVFKVFETKKLCDVIPKDPSHPLLEIKPHFRNIPLVSRVLQDGDSGSA